MLAKRLVKLGVKIVKNANHYFPYHFAIRKCLDAAEFLKILKPSFADLITKDMLGRTAFESAAYYGNQSALQWILACFAENKKEVGLDILTNAFKHAWKKGHKEVVADLFSMLEAELSRGEMRNIYNELCTSDSNEEIVVVLAERFGIVPDQSLLKVALTLPPEQRKAIALCMNATVESLDEQRLKLEKSIIPPTISMPTVR